MSQRPESSQWKPQSGAFELPNLRVDIMRNKDGQDNDGGKMVDTDSSIPQVIFQKSCLIDDLYQVEDQQTLN